MVRVDIQDNSACIIMSGQFNFQVHRPFKQAYAALLENKNIVDITIDMERLTYMDSSALGMLLLLREFVNGDSKRVVITNCNHEIRKIFKIANDPPEGQISDAQIDYMIKVLQDYEEATLRVRVV